MLEVFSNQLSGFRRNQRWRQLFKMCLRALGLFLLPLVVVVGAEKKSRGTKSLCTIPEKNMSLASLGENDYYTAENRDDKTVIYLSLCHPLR